MAMRPCKKCLGNSWKFVYDNGLILATCNNCGNEVEFKAKEKINKPKPASWYLPSKPKKTKKGDSIFIQNGCRLNSTQLKQGVKIELYGV